MPLRSKLILYAVIMLLLFTGLSTGYYLSLSSAARDAESARAELMKVTLLEEVAARCTHLAGDVAVDPVECLEAQRKLLELKDREWSPEGHAHLDRILALAAAVQAGDPEADLGALHRAVADRPRPPRHRLKQDLRAAHEPAHKRAVRLLIAACLATVGGAATFAWLYGRLVRERRGLEERVLRSEKLAALGTFAAGIAHEINNPLTTISMSAEALADRLSADADAAAYAHAIQEETARCQSIVGDLSDLARGGSLDREPVDPEALAEDAVRLVRRNQRLPRAEIEESVPGDLPLVSADRGKLLQVLVNLLRNGVEATGEGGRVRLTAALEDGNLTFTVTDDGRGIRPHLLNRIFEPFYTDKEQGVGLGLALCHRIAELHGGELRALSPGPGRGSTFTLVVPLESDGHGA